MTVECEVKAETVQVAAEVAAKVEEPVKYEKVEESKPKMVEKSSSYREESNILSDLKEHEKKALTELKAKLEEAILGNAIFNKEAAAAPAPEKKEEEKPAVEACEEKEDEKEEEKPAVEVCEVEVEEEKPIEKCAEPEPEPEAEPEVIDEDISIWGVPLLPSKGNESTNVVLLKFLRAREFKVNEAFEMLKKTLQWRKEFKIDSILEEEEFEAELASAAYMSGVDREGHPICYNIFGVLEREGVYEKTVATEEKREQFLRWRVQLMEKGVQKLDFKPDGINSLLHVNDLKNSAGVSKKEVRASVNKAVALLQDNYPEFVAKNVSIFKSRLYSYIFKKRIILNRSKGRE